MKLGYDIIPLLKSCPWGGFSPTSIKYCEENLCALITAPANTWSNLAYFYVAWLIKKNQTTENKTINQLFFIAAVATGLGSFLYHASFTSMFQVADFIGMFMFSSLLLTLNLKRLKLIKNFSTNKSYFLMFLLTTSLFIFFRANLGKTMFSLHLGVILFLELILYFKIKTKYQTESIDYKWFKWSVVLFICAYLAWWLDTAHVWCNPQNHFLQGHAIWHIVNAFCFYTMTKFYENLRDQ